MCHARWCGIHRESIPWLFVVDVILEFIARDGRSFKIRPTKMLAIFFYLHSVIDHRHTFASRDEANFEYWHRKPKTDWSPEERHKLILHPLARWLFGGAH